MSSLHNESQGLPMARLFPVMGAGAFGHLHPLVSVQPDGIEHLRGELRVGPVGLLESGQAEVHEHAEAQVHKLLLQLMQAFGLSGGMEQTCQQRNQYQKSLFHNLTR